MKTLVVDFKDMTDSKLFLNKKIPNFMLFFIYLLLAMLIILLVWMWFGELDIVVKAKGIVRPNKSISIIKNYNRNKIKEIFYYEGKKVNKNEILYVLDTSSDEKLVEVKKDLLENEQKEFKNLNLFDKSLKERKNYFTESEIKYYNRYLSYKIEEEQMRINYKRNNQRYNQEKSLGLDFTTKSKLNDLKGKVDYSKMTMEKMRSDEIIKIKNEIVQKEIKIMNLENEIGEIEKRIKQGKVKSSIEGTIQVIEYFNVGDFIDIGKEVLRIIPKDMTLKVEIEVENRNIGQIKLGQKVNYRFLALPYKEFGVISGKINKISSDTSYSNFDSNHSYKIESDLNKSILFNRKNEKGIVKIGMVSNVMIVTRKRKIFFVMLEKLNFIDL